MNCRPLLMLAACWFPVMAGAAPPDAGTPLNRANGADLVRGKRVDRKAKGDPGTYGNTGAGQDTNTGVDRPGDTGTYGNTGAGQDTNTGNSR